VSRGTPFGVKLGWRENGAATGTGSNPEAIRAIEERRCQSPGPLPEWKGFANCVVEGDRYLFGQLLSRMRHPVLAGPKRYLSPGPRMASRLAAPKSTSPLAPASLSSSKAGGGECGDVGGRGMLAE
jgi:hypothetical protein